MTLHQRINNDFLKSYKEKDEARISLLRLVKSALKNFAIAKLIKDDELADEQVVQVLRQEIKRRKESIEAFTKGDRADLVAHEQVELAILESYVPASLTDEQIATLIREVVAEQALVPPYQFGLLMGAVVKKVAGRADGTAVKAAVQVFIGT